MVLSDTDHVAFERAQASMLEIRGWIESHSLPDRGDAVSNWFKYANQFQTALGNVSMQLSLLSCLLAKEYLCSVLPMMDFDVAAKPQGAAGLDIDAKTIAGERVVAEIKTTRPYRLAQVDANQRNSILKDLAKLRQENAEYKFMYFTDSRALMIATQSFANELHGIAPVHLS